MWSPSPTTPGEWRVYVDIIAPADWLDTSVRMVDLDLDVYRSFDGRVRMLDEDEFADHQVALGYPQHLIEGARQSADRVLELVRNEVEPFGATGTTWLAKATEFATR
jgi:hypothetical protein